MDWEETQQARFNRIIDREMDSLLRKSSTEYNFTEVEAKVEKVIEATKLLKDNFEFWSQLPQEMRDEINTKLDQTASIFDEMRDFDPKQNDAWTKRNNLIVRFNREYKQIYSYLVERIHSYLGQKAYSKELTSKFGQEAKAELSEIRKVKKEIEKIKKDVQEAETIAGDVASTATAKSFDDQAKEHKIKASEWLVYIIILSVCALIIALTVTYQIIREISQNQTITDNTEASLFKLALLAFLYFFMRFLIKNYGAHQHLYVINKHRANVLKGMEAFRTSATSDETKDTVLLAAVSAAFNQTETGFISTKEGAGSEDNDISDILRLTGKK